jgi:peptidylprolyl isomerase
MFKRFWSLLVALALSVAAVRGAEPVPRKFGSLADVLAASGPGDWRPLDPENTLYLELPSGRVVIELAPAFAPRHVANVKALVREHYYDGLAIVRAQDNYVVQWGDPNAEQPALARKVRHAAARLPAEFENAIIPGNSFQRLPDGDVYALEVGFLEGLRVARDPQNGKMWLIHCYGMVGAGREVPSDSGGGTELYVVIGHAPRHLDRNVTLLGRVVQGMELLSTLPRGTGALGFYTKPEERVPIKALRQASEVPASERTVLEALRTDTPLFQELLAFCRSRDGEWFKFHPGRVEIANVPLPVRRASRREPRFKPRVARLSQPRAVRYFPFRISGGNPHPRPSPSPPSGPAAALFP